VKGGGRARICCHLGGRGLYLLAALSRSGTINAQQDHARRTAV
jgi:hypothetical protein